MKLEVPFYKQTKKLNCGPAALRMVIAYFDKDIGLEVLEERAGIEEGRGVFTVQIALAAARSGYKTEFFSKSVYFNEENLELDFYKKYFDMIQHSKKVVEDAKNEGVKIEERGLSLEELLEKTGKNSIPIVLVDWNVVRGTKERGYQGHFVPVVGYDEDSIYVHNHGFENPTPFLQIKREVFEEARKAKGTDEDVVVVYRRV